MNVEYECFLQYQMFEVYQTFKSFSQALRQNDFSVPQNGRQMLACGAAVLHILVLIGLDKNTDTDFFVCKMLMVKLGIAYVTAGQSQSDLSMAYLEIWQSIHCYKWEMSARSQTWKKCFSVHYNSFAWNAFREWSLYTF